MSVDEAVGVDAHEKLFARVKTTARGASPDVVVIVKVTAEDMATSMLGDLDAGEDALRAHCAAGAQAFST